MESDYTKHIIEMFEKSFSNSWIENMEWTSPAKKKQSFKQGLNSIEHFRENMVVQCSKMILSGDHLVNETNALDRLQVSIEEKVEDITYDKTLKSKLSSEYQSFLQDLLDIARLVKIHVNQTKKNFLPNEQVILGNFITYDRNRGNRHKMVTLMDWICESCAMEYCFSYDESYINDLLLLRQCVLDEKQKLAGEIYNVFTAVLGKIELLLCKLSAFSKGGKISYYHDLKLETIGLEDADKYKINDFRFLFKKYLNPSELDEQIVDIWQTESLNQNVAMWQLAFLMRYYTKCTKSIQQINNLLKLAEHHHEEYIKGNEKNIVNDCADRSFLNYMYNSRFSFLCQNQKGYSYEDMKRDLEKIEEVQAQTFIKNYHPYQTALDFTLKVVELKKSNSEKFEDISALVSDLNT